MVNYMGKEVGIVKDWRYLDHAPSFQHPESPQRLEAIYRTLSEEGIEKNLTLIIPRLAEIGELRLIHSDPYIEKVKATEGISYSMLDPDTYTSSASFEVARLAVGGVLEAIAKVINGDLSSAFALIRPPGHHAERERGMGFCLFNNVAIGAEFAKRRYGIDRVLIIDWDLHHGNGTQHAFYDTDSVLYFSTHQYPYYPGTGALTEVGEDKGRGFTVNVPLSFGVDDIGFEKIFLGILKPVALQYSPELILVSAGFDIFCDDPLGGMMVTSKGFASLTRIVKGIAQKCCQGKVILLLEGGYDLKGLSSSVKEVILELLSKNYISLEELKIKEEARQEAIDKLVESVAKFQRPFWSAL